MSCSKKKQKKQGLDSFQLLYVNNNYKSVGEAKRQTIIENWSCSLNKKMKESDGCLCFTSTGFLNKFVCKHFSKINKSLIVIISSTVTSVMTLYMNKGENLSWKEGNSAVTIPQESNGNLSLKTKCK